jgi:hypothetical protein
MIDERRFLLALERIADAMEEQNKLYKEYTDDSQKYMQLQTRWTELLLKVNGELE